MKQQKSEQLQLSDYLPKNADKDVIIDTYKLFLEELKITLKKISSENEIDEKYLEIYTHTDNGIDKNQHSLRLDRKNFLSLECLVTKGIKISIPRKIYRLLNNKFDFKYEFNIKNNYYKYIIDYIDDEFKLYVETLSRIYLENYTPSDTIGCCSKYIECSNKKKCLHNDKFYAKRCAYRKNLEKGRIFYGVNKNI